MNFYFSNQPVFQISEAVGSKNPLLPSMRSLECWQNAQNKRPQEAEASLHTRGCLQPLKSLFENNAVYIGSFVAIVIVPVVGYNIYFIYYSN